MLEGYLHVFMTQLKQGVAREGRTMMSSYMRKSAGTVVSLENGMSALLMTLEQRTKRVTRIGITMRRGEQ